MPASTGAARPDLAGLQLVVTRPRAQGEITAHLLRGFGAEVLLFPVLDIGPLPAQAVTRSFAPERLARLDAIVFISANAVQFGLPLIRAWGGLPAKTEVFAIGRATAQALLAAGVGAVSSPATGNDSEAMLAMPQLQNVPGRSIAIVRGISEGGGRTLLADTLRSRGASIWPLECYQRRAISAAQADKDTLSLQLQQGAVHGILVLSVETLDSLVENIADMPLNREAMLLSSHQRIAAAARAQGFRRTEIVPMGDDALSQALQRLKPALLGMRL